jgi:cation diffusion facilitator family transporter
LAGSAAGHCLAMASESRTTVLVAIGANGLIAAAKVVAGVGTGSSAMLAEAAHSIADTVNECMLLVSLVRADREPDEQHPFGYGKERFFWAFLVAVFIFLLGGIFSVLEGGYRLLRGSESEGGVLAAFVVLAIAFVAEGVSFLRALRQTRREARGQDLSWRRYIRVSKEPTAKTVVSEDAAAIAGVVIAFLGIGLDQLTGIRVFDPIASILIGLLLCTVAYALGRDVKGLLLGEAARPDQRRELRRVLAGHPGVRDVVELLTMYVGPESLLVAARIDLDDGLSGADVERLSNRLERELRAAVPDVDQVFLDATPGARRRAATGRARP